MLLLSCWHEGGFRIGNLRFIKSMGSLRNHSKNISFTFSSNENLRARRSLYLRIYLLEASSPSSDKCSSPCPSLSIEIISGACANSLCNVGETLAQGNSQRIAWYNLLKQVLALLYPLFCCYYRRVGLLLGMCEFQLCGT